MQVLCQEANTSKKDLQTNEPSQSSFFRACPVLQILGGSKARILQSCLRPGDAVLESLD